MKNPWFVVTVLMVLGLGLLVTGVYLLAGAGWACIAAAIPMVAGGVTLLKGLSRGQ